MTTVTPLKSLYGPGSLVRPLFYPGLLLEDDDLTSAVDYTRSNVRLLLRSLFGCGVVCGLKVSAEYACQKRKVVVTVDKGVALDCVGNLIEVQSSKSIEYDPECKPMPDELWVVVCYAERGCQPSSVCCSEEDDARVVNRRRQDMFEIRLYRDPPECACACNVPKPTNKPKPDDRCCTDAGDSDTQGAGANGTANGSAAAAAAATGAAAGTSTRSTAADPLAGLCDPKVTLDPSCDCYTDHNCLDCSCECDCCCVLVGHVTLNLEAQKPTSDGDHRRIVRPMLLGAWRCYCEACQGQRPHGPNTPSDAVPSKPDPMLTETSTPTRINELIAQIRGSMGRNDERRSTILAELERVRVSLQAADAAVQAAQAIAANAQDAEKIKALQAKETAEQQRAALQKNQQQLERQRDELSASIQADEGLLNRQIAQRDIALKQMNLAFVDRQIRDAEASGIQAQAQALRDERVSLLGDIRASIDLQLV